MKRIDQYIDKTHKISSDFQDGLCPDKVRFYSKGKCLIEKPNGVADATDARNKVAQEKTSEYESNHNSYCENIDKKENTHLNIVTARKMIQRFLVEKKMTMEELAKALKVDEKNLDQLFSPKVSLELISSVSLPLIKLYCTTEWDKSKQ